MAGGGAAARGLARVGQRARAAGWGRPLGPEETLGLLEASVVQREGALLALSKPPGLPVLGRPGELSLVMLLPALRRRLGLPAELHVVKAPARECSGLVLLSGCHRATEQLQRFFTNARRRGQYPATYHAVTVGVPAEAEGEIRTGLCWQRQGDTAAVVPVPAPGRRSLARKEVKSTLTRYRVLGAAGGCALLQLQPRTGAGRGAAVPAGALAAAAPPSPAPHPPAAAGSAPGPALRPAAPHLPAHPAAPGAAGAPGALEAAVGPPPRPTPAPPPH
ncbi:mitochondrial mRNA pseudouridine synthase RPUSD3 isoform 2-T2 [Theristicus caerulescens]